MDEFNDSLKLRQQMIPLGLINRKSVRKIDPTSITVHNTANTKRGANAAAHGNFVTKTGYYVLKNGKKNPVSWHFTVDDVEAVQHLALDELALHAGRANATSIAIEICMHQGINQPQADLRAARLVAKLLADLGLQANAVHPHKFWTGKNCPQLLLGAWQAFLKKVADARAELPQKMVEDDIFAPPEGYATPLDDDRFAEPDDTDLEVDIDHDALTEALQPTEN